MKKPTLKKHILKENSGNAQPAKGGYVLYLYIAGTSLQSARALENVKNICEDYLSGKYTLKVIDIYQQPALLKDEQIIAAPTLIKKQPFPLRRLIGNMANTDRVLLGLDLIPRHPDLAIPI